MAWNLQDPEGLLYEDRTLEDFTASDVYNGTDDFIDFIEFEPARTVPTIALAPDLQACKNDANFEDGTDFADAKGVPTGVDLKKRERR